MKLYPKVCQNFRHEGETVFFGTKKQVFCSAKCRRQSFIDKRETMTYHLSLIVGCSERTASLLVEHSQGKSIALVEAILNLSGYWYQPILAQWNYVRDEDKPRKIIKIFA